MMKKPVANRPPKSHLFQASIYLSMVMGTLLFLGTLDAFANQERRTLLNLCNATLTDPHATSHLRALIQIPRYDKIGVFPREGTRWIEGQLLNFDLVSESFVLSTAEGEHHIFHTSEINWREGLVHYLPEGISVPLLRSRYEDIQDERPSISAPAITAPAVDPRAESTNTANALRHVQMEDMLGRYTSEDLVGLRTWSSNGIIEGFIEEILPNGSIRFRRRDNGTHLVVKPETLVPESVHRVHRSSTPFEEGRTQDSRTPIIPGPSPEFQRLSFSRHPEITVARVLDSVTIEQLQNYAQTYLEQFPYQLAPLNSPHDQYFTGTEAAYTYGMDSRTPPAIEVPLPRAIQSIQQFDLGFETFRLPDQTVEERLAHELERGQSLEQNTTFAGRGGLSIAYFVHGQIPVGIKKKIEAATTAGRAGEAERIRRQWASRYGQHVIVLADPEPQAIEGAGAMTPERVMGIIYQGVRRRLVQRHLANHLFPHFFNPQTMLPAIRMNRLLSTPAQHARGVFKEEIIRGEKLDELASAEHRINQLNELSQTRPLEFPELAQLAMDQTLLSSLQHTPESARFSVELARAIYRRLHPLVISYGLLNGLEPAGNTLLNEVDFPSGISQLPLSHFGEQLRIGRPIGFDFNHGDNLFVTSGDEPLITNDL